MEMMMENDPPRIKAGRDNTQHKPGTDPVDDLLLLDYKFAVCTIFPIRMQLIGSVGYGRCVAAESSLMQFAQSARAQVSS